MGEALPGLQVLVGPEARDGQRLKEWGLLSLEKVQVEPCCCLQPPNQRIWKTKPDSP